MAMGELAQMLKYPFKTDHNCLHFKIKLKEFLKDNQVCSKGVGLHRDSRDMTLPTFQEAQICPYQLLSNLICIIFGVI